MQLNSVDYANDSFDYTDDGTNNYLHAFCVAYNPLQAEIEVAASKNQGSVSPIVYDDMSLLLHERD